MDFGQNQGDERKYYYGNWTCSKCGTAITKLPFEPDPERVNSLKCFDCHRADKQSRGGGGGGGGRPFRR